MTGRGLGYCAGYDRPGYQMGAPPYGRGFGWGAGRGYGRGRGLGHGYWRGFDGFGRGADSETEPGVTHSLADEVARLREQVQALEQRLADSDGAD
jgi:hypothetical protein